MTEDPTFNERADLAPQHVGRVHIATDHHGLAGRTMKVPRVARPVFLADTWPSFTAEMPYASRIEKVPAHGAVSVLVDNEALIDARIKASNQESGWPPPGHGAGGCGTGGNGAVGVTATGGPSGAGGGGTNGDVAGSGGCGCFVAGSDRGWQLGVFGAIAALEVARRRKKRRA